MDDVGLPDLAVHHFSISVPNIDEAAAWYRRILGFTVESRFEIGAIPARAAFLVRDSLRIEVWELAGNQVPESRKEPHLDLRSGGMKHIAFRVPKLRDRLVRLQSMDVDIAATQASPDRPMVPFTPASEVGPGIFAAFIRDPFGVLIELLDEQGLQAV